MSALKDEGAGGSSERGGLATPEHMRMVMDQTRKGQFGLLKQFCEALDPRKGNEEALRGVDWQENEGFFSFVMSEIAASSPLEYVLLVRLFARNSDLESLILSYGGIITLCQILRTSDDRDIIDNACTSIGLLATNEQIRKSLAEEGAINLIVKHMKKRKSEQAFQILACKVLNNACFRENENKTTFIECGGFMHLISLFEVSSVALHCNASLLLRTITHLDQDRPYLLDTVPSAIDDVMNVVCQVLEDVQDNPIIGQHILWVIMNLTVDDYALKRKFGEKGVVIRVLELLRANVEDEPLQTIGISLLLQLMRKKYNRMAIGKVDGVVDIVSTLRHFRRNNELLLKGTELLNRICVHGINRKRIIKAENTLADVLLILKENMTNQELVVSLLELFYKIASGATESKYALRSLDALSLFSEMMSHYPDNTIICNLSNNSISEVFRNSKDLEEDSDEDWSSDEGEEGPGADPDSDDSPEEDASPAPEPSKAKRDGMESVEFSLLSLKRAIADERNEELAETVHKLNEDIEGLNEMLEMERKERKEVEEELKLIKKIHGEAITREQEKTSLLLQTEEENSHLKREVLTLTQQVEKLKSFETENSSLKNLTLKLEAELKASSEDQQALKVKALDEEIDHLRLKLNKQNTYLSSLEDLVQKLRQDLDTKTSKYKDRIRKLKVNAQGTDKEGMEDQLFYWMTVAIRLDFMMHNRVQNVNIDRTELFNRIKQESEPTSAWPKIILDALLATNTAVYSNSSPSQTLHRTQSERRAPSSAKSSLSSKK
eukprot:TRINITY_DN5353_c0_g1_i1.p1 TRINITY_DN5353_c0_g1~~TRINITY_DN5353_c0_g1_i1.p1  ORF type:complete len:779 (+),score=187.26 TRINITY_DN5353_c0_g1_i1:74-2410(+)